MSGKSQIKHDVFRLQFAECVRAIPKEASSSKNNFVPPAEPEDASDTMANVRYGMQDAGILLHGYDNVVRVDPDDEDAGYKVSGATGESLAGYLMSQTGRAFRDHALLETMILIMDKSAFMPRPKQYVQMERATTLLDTMEQKGIMPIDVPDNGQLPVIVAPFKALPPWIAVRSKSTLYRHATAELLDLIVRDYRPPPGRRVILDFMDKSAGSPDTIDTWMCSERIICDEYARATIENARVLLRERSDWRARARELVDVLGHAGHIESVPICIETTVDGTRLTPFLLENAANACGEADVGVSFWWKAMCADRVQNTLAGRRRKIVEIPDAVAEFYSPDELAAARRAASVVVPVTKPESSEERRAWARQVVGQFEARSRDANAPPLTAEPQELERAYLLLREPGLLSPCLNPNRGLVMSSDTDFLSLLLITFAQIAMDADLDGKPMQWCLDNSVLLSTGECQVLRCGHLSGPQDYYKKPDAAKKRKLADEGGQPPVEPEHYTAHEIWDIAGMAFKLRNIMAQRAAEDEDDEETVGNVWHLERAASFAAFTASCGNDYLAGLCGVNRGNMWKAFFESGALLVKYDERQKICVIRPDKYREYIKHCYWHSINGAIGKANKPTKPASQMTYAEMAALVRKKNMNRPTWHMPSDERLALMYQRTQWWLVYVMHSYNSITTLLDDKVCGWPPGTTDVMV